MNSPPTSVPSGQSCSRPGGGREITQARPALVPRWSRESGHSAGIRGQRRSRLGGRWAGEIPGQGRSRPGGECGASWNRTSDLTLISADCCRGVCPGERLDIVLLLALVPCPSRSNTNGGFRTRQWRAEDREGTRHPPPATRSRQSIDDADRGSTLRRCLLAIAVDEPERRPEQMELRSQGHVGCPAPSTRMSTGSVTEGRGRRPPCELGQ
jgi:hypothetical protein